MADPARPGTSEPPQGLAAQSPQSGRARQTLLRPGSVRPARQLSGQQRLPEDRGAGLRTRGVLTGGRTATALAPDHAHSHAVSGVRGPGPAQGGRGPAAAASVHSAFGYSLLWIRLQQQPKVTFSP